MVSMSYYDLPFKVGVPTKFKTEPKRTNLGNEISSFIKLYQAPSQHIAIAINKFSLLVKGVIFGASYFSQKMSNLAGFFKIVPQH